MSATRRQFLKAGAAGGAALLVEVPLFGRKSSAAVRPQSLDLDRRRRRRHARRRTLRDGPGRADVARDDPRRGARGRPRRREARSGVAGAGLRQPLRPAAATASRTRGCRCARRGPRRARCSSRRRRRRGGCPPAECSGAGRRRDPRGDRPAPFLRQARRARVDASRAEGAAAEGPEGLSPRRDGRAARRRPGDRVGPGGLRPRRPHAGNAVRRRRALPGPRGQAPPVRRREGDGGPRGREGRGGFDGCRRRRARQLRRVLRTRRARGVVGRGCQRVAHERRAPAAPRRSGLDPAPCAPPDAPAGRRRGGSGRGPDAGRGVVPGRVPGPRLGRAPELHGEGVRRALRDLGADAESAAGPEGVRRAPEARRPRKSTCTSRSSAEASAAGSTPITPPRPSRSRAPPGVPVQVVWSREDDFLGDYLHPSERADLEAGIDASGKITAWTHRSTCFHLSMFGDFDPADSENDVGPWGGYDTPYAIENLSAEYTEVESPIRTGAWRAVYYPPNVFARESLRGRGRRAPRPRSRRAAALAPRGRARPDASQRPLEDRPAAACRGREARGGEGRLGSPARRPRRAARRAAGSPATSTTRGR